MSSKSTLDFCPTIHQWYSNYHRPNILVIFIIQLRMDGINHLLTIAIVECQHKIAKLIGKQLREASNKNINELTPKSTHKNTQKTRELMISLHTCCLPFSTLSLLSLNSHSSPRISFSSDALFPFLQPPPPSEF